MRRFREGEREYEQASVQTKTNTFARTPADRAAWFAFYRELIQLRRKQPAFGAVVVQVAAS